MNWQPHEDGPQLVRRVRVIKLIDSVTRNACQPTSHTALDRSVALPLSSSDKFQREADKRDCDFYGQDPVTTLPFVSYFPFYVRDTQLQPDFTQLEPNYATLKTRPTSCSSTRQLTSIPFLPTGLAPILPSPTLEPSFMRDLLLPSRRVRCRGGEGASLESSLEFRGEEDAIRKGTIPRGTTPLN
jgi:hypothetical protein